MILLCILICCLTTSAEEEEEEDDDIVELSAGEVAWQKCLDLNPILLLSFRAS